MVPFSHAIVATRPVALVLAAVEVAQADRVVVVVVAAVLVEHPVGLVRTVRALRALW